MRRRLIENISLPIKPISESVAADICIVDNNTLDKLIIEADDYNLETFPLEQYTPIGVVVVPASHTDDGTARIISLAYMDYNNPDNGKYQIDNIYEEIYFGAYGYDMIGFPNLLNKRISAPSININLNVQTIQKWVTTIPLSYFCTDCLDNISGNCIQNPFDLLTYYPIEGYSSYKLPSPYLNDGGKNPIYHSTEDTGNILSDMNGKENTKILLDYDNNFSTDWQTAIAIQNVYNNEYIHPSAQCCWRYHTVGTQQGDWYLPSVGESMYLISRFKKIRQSFILLKNLDVNCINLYIDGELGISEGLCTSNDIERNYFLKVSFDALSVFSCGKNDNSAYVIPFCKV